MRFMIIFLLKLTFKSENAKKNYNSTYIAASCGKIQTFLVYHRTVIILKGFKSVVKLRYIKASLIFRPVTV